MSQTLGITGSLRFQPTESSQSATVPMAMANTFTQRAGFDIYEAEPVTNLAVPMGSIEKPVMVYVEVTQGAFHLSTDAGGDGGFSISVDSVPAPSDKAYLILYNPAPQAMALYLTTEGPAAGRIWIFG